MNQNLLAEQHLMEKFATEYDTFDAANEIAQLRTAGHMKALDERGGIVPCKFRVSQRGSKYVIERRARSDDRLLDIL